MAERSGYCETNDIGSIYLNGCTPFSANGIEITVADAWDDFTPRRHILLTCHGGAHGIEYAMDCDKAEALGLLLLSAARGMRAMAAQLDSETEEC